MNKRRLRHTDLDASVLTLGTALFGSDISEREAFRLLDMYSDAGGNFLDTSLNYADWQWPVKGISEKTIGKWMKLRGNRHHMMVGTKGACPSLNNGPFLRLHRDDILSDLQQSLHNLQTDTIDLYYLHRDDPSRPVSDILDVLEEQAERGSIRYYACSNWSLPRLVEAQQYAERTGVKGFVANQMMWSLAEVNRHHLTDSTLVAMDTDMKEYHRRTGLTAVPYSSQANGFFSGKYARGDDRSETVAGRFYYSEVNFARLDRVREQARERGASSSNIALAYMLSQSHGFDVFPIIGPKNAEQLEDSLKAAELAMNEESMRLLEGN
ncbi:aldo/keto reductase [Paenibacillus sp. J5C_2022]|uniref:aldo/keto reductase n=1 Tax=Paenibacillus sp. J5C2022 TaxID=2977129 RepID=UPI0021CF5016|nr:aldo/keto reductase [Paenibacillus sp. J5C2022]MCU6708705.1 aldo/keto reductase [Paenibacillus sp. J5C2022]